MNLSDFFSSTPGIYMAQSFCHALISVIIVESAIRIWRIQEPMMMQRFRFIVMIFPIFSWPVYQILNPDRGSIHFRLETLFDSNRWLNLSIGGVIPFHLIFLSLLFLSAMIFIFQEMIPIVKHTHESKSRKLETRHPDPDSVVLQVLQEISGSKPDVLMVDDEDYILFSSTGRNPSVFLSTGLIQALDRDQLQVALVHEMAHISRNKRPFLLFIFLLRVLMFFNPVILIEFRKIVQEEEKICDDMAARITQKPHALAETLRKLFRTAEVSSTFRLKKLSGMKKALEEYSQTMLIESRIKRLEQGTDGIKERSWSQWIMTLMVISLINYYVV